MNPRLYSALRNTEPLGYIRYFQFLDLAKQDDVSIDRWKARDEFRDRAGGFAPPEFFLRV
jgi:hypothetical protein